MDDDLFLRLQSEGLSGPVAQFIAHLDRELYELKDRVKRLEAERPTPKQFKVEPIEPVTVMRDDYSERANEFLGTFYRAVEGELMHHIAKGRRVEQCCGPMSPGVILSRSVMIEGTITTLSVVTIEADSLDTPVMRLVVQRRVP